MNPFAFALRNANALWDLQCAAARRLWGAQSEASAAVDAPEFAAFVRAMQHGACELFAQSAAQMLTNLRDATHRFGAMQLRLARLTQARSDEAGIGLADGAAMVGAIADVAAAAATQPAGEALAAATLRPAPLARAIGATVHGAARTPTSTGAARPQTPVRNDTRSHAPARTPVRATAKASRRGSAH